MSGIVVGAVVAGAGAYMSYRSSKQAASAQQQSLEMQQQQAAVQQRMSNIQNARTRQQQAAAARVARASIISQGVAQGVTGSTGIAGAVAGVQQKEGFNISFMDNMANLNQQALIFGQKAADYSAQAQQYGAKSQLWGNVSSIGYSQFGGQQGFQSIGSGIKKIFD